MKFIKKLFDFYLSANIHVAVSATALVQLTLLFYGIESDTGLLVLVLMATIVSYNFIEAFGMYIAQNTGFRAALVNRRALIVLNIIGVLYVVLFLFTMSFQSILTIFPFVLFVFFYIVPFRGDKQNLRSIAGFKLFLIAASWAGVTVLFPLVYESKTIDLEVVLIFLQRFFFISAIAIPFDIRDASFDHGSLKTIPQLFGPLKAKIFGSISLMIFFVLEFFRAVGADLVVTGLITFIAWCFLIFSKEDQNRYYTVFWVEAVPIFWLILYIVLK